MTRAGRALRDGWALDRAAAQLCACGHPMGEHRELQPDRVIIDGEIVETPHPEYKPGLFFCGIEGCGCRVQL
jgi:hypothetical protein